MMIDTGNIGNSKGDKWFNLDIVASKYRDPHITPKTNKYSHQQTRCEAPMALTTVTQWAPLRSSITLILTITLSKWITLLTASIKRRPIPKIPLCRLIRSSLGTKTLLTCLPRALFIGRAGMLWVSDNKLLCLISYLGYTLYLIFLCSKLKTQPRFSYFWLNISRAIFENILKQFWNDI